MQLLQMTWEKNGKYTRDWVLLVKILIKEKNLSLCLC